jgi:hypothetical protein
MDQETDARKLLNAAISQAADATDAIATAFREPWKLDPSEGVRAVFGVWINKSIRHLVAISTLTGIEGLGLIAEVHCRQLLEIFLQARYMAATSPQERERLAEKISAWGCVEWLVKMEPLKDQAFATAGWTEMTTQLTKYDPALVLQVKSEQAQHYYWFGPSFSKLARHVSRKGEDLVALYHLSSTQLHGAWDITLGVSNPKQGVLDFREWPDRATLYRWAADVVDRGKYFTTQTWNEIASATGAPHVH